MKQGEEDGWTVTMTKRWRARRAGRMRTALGMD